MAADVVLDEINQMKKNVKMINKGLIAWFKQGIALPR
jgi:hypothetical protein